MEIPPELEKVGRMLKRRAVHFANDTASDARAWLSSNVGETGVGIGVGGLAIWQIYDTAMEQKYGVVSRIGPRAGIDRWSMWRHTLAMTSDYHKSITKNLPIFRQQWQRMMLSMNGLDKAAGLTSGHSPANAVEDILRRFLNSNQSDADKMLLRKGFGDLKSNYSHIVTDIQAIEDEFFRISNAHEYIIKHFSQNIVGRGWANIANIVHTDEVARIKNVRSILGQALNEYDANRLWTNEIDDLLSKTGTHPTLAEWHMIKNSKGAQKAIVEAVNAKDAVKMQEVISVARKATMWAAGFNILGIAGDIWSLAQINEELEEIDAKIKTAEPELKQVLERQKVEIYQTKILPILSLTGQVGVSTIAWWQGAGVLGAMGANSALLGPAGILIAGGTYALHTTHEFERAMSETYGDYLKKTNEELLVDLGVHAQGVNATDRFIQHGTFIITMSAPMIAHIIAWKQGPIVDGRTDLTDESIESAKEYHRAEIVRAYIAKNTVIPPYPGEEPKEYVNRHQKIVSEIMRSLAKQKSPDGQYTLNLTSESLNDARIDGELTIFSRQCEEQENGLEDRDRATVVVLGNDGKNHVVSIAEYQYMVEGEDGKSCKVNEAPRPYSRKAVRIAWQNRREEYQLDAFKEEITKDGVKENNAITVIAAKLLSDCSDDLNFYSHALLSYNYTGLGDSMTVKRILNIAENVIAREVMQSAEMYHEDIQQRSSPTEYRMLYNERLNAIRSTLKGLSPQMLHERVKDPEYRHLQRQLSERDEKEMSITLASIVKHIKELQESKSIKERQEQRGEKIIYTLQELTQARIIESKHPIYLQNMQGYRLVRMIDGISLSEKSDIIIPSNDPYRIEVSQYGTYAIWSPQEGITRQNSPIGKLGKISFRTSITDRERFERNNTRDLRFKKGAETLVAGGAKKIGQNCYESHNGEVLYYFDRERARWNVVRHGQPMNIEGQMDDNSIEYRIYKSASNINGMNDINELEKSTFPKNTHALIRAIFGVNKKNPAPVQPSPEQPQQPPITEPTPQNAV